MLSLPLCHELARMGHDVKVVGLHYGREEHAFPFTIVGTKSLKEAGSMVQNIFGMWRFDVLVVALDIPLHDKYLKMFEGRPFKYVGIMPVEGDPLCLTWAMTLMQMDKVYVISKFGTEEARKAGVKAIHIPVGIDSEAWRLPTQEERMMLRGAMGFSKDTFAVLTVAYNHERKNLSGGMEIFAEFVNKHPESNAKYVLVTVEHSQVGWKLRDYAQELGINNRVLIIEKGIEFSKLWGMYACCDAFLLPSKAEGLGLPILESMAVGLPVVATNCTAITETLESGRGKLVSFDYIDRNPFGNERRYFIDIDDGVKQLESVYFQDGVGSDMAKRARSYVERLTWEKAASVLDGGLKSL